MANPKKYFHDHLVLLLLSVNAFLAAAATVLVLLSLSTDQGNVYIYQCRDCSNPTAVNRFTNGGVIDLLSFAVFAVLMFVGQYLLSLRAYRIHRQLTLAILSLGIVLLVFTIMVANSLLLLR